MLHNLRSVFKTKLTMINNQMQKNKKLEKNKVLFKAIEEKETRIKVEHKAFSNFITKKLNAKSQRGSAKKKNYFVQQVKYKKCGCKHLVEQIYKHANKDCKKCHKKKHITCFHDSYTSLNKENNSKRLITSR